MPRHVKSDAKKICCSVAWFLHEMVALFISRTDDFGFYFFVFRLILNFYFKVSRIMSNHYGVITNKVCLFIFLIHCVICEFE